MVFVELLLTGMLGGFLAGLLGIGGGFVVVPVLWLLLPALGVDADIVPKVAVATSLAAMVPTALSATLAQYRRGALDIKWLRRIAPAAAIGAILGSQAAAALSGAWVGALFAVYTGFFAIKMVRDRPLHPESPGCIARAFQEAPVPLVALVIGGFSAIAGVGGSSLTVPFLLFRGLDMKRTVAVSSAVGLTIALTGSVGFAAPMFFSGSSPAASGLVCWPAAMLLAAAAVGVAPRGVAVSHALPVRHLKRAFAAVLMVVCATTLAKTVTTPSFVASARSALFSAT